MGIQFKGQYINGQWIKGHGQEFSSINPSNNMVLWNGRNATIDETDKAVLAAKEAFKVWSKLDLSERLAYLQAFIDVLKSNKIELAESISSEIGKPLWESVTEIGAMIGKLEPTQQSFKERNSEIFRKIPNGISRTCFRPHGVVAVIGPYNFPGHMPNGQIMPALIAGNTVIFKPSEYAPAFAEKMIDCWIQAGLPNGVLNLLQGDASVGKFLCQNPNVSGIFFTGSKNVGETILSITSMNKICALEMGGNSPLIVWDTSDIDAAVLATIQSAFITSGQRCSAARRLIVPSNKFGENFISQLIETAKSITVGRPNDIPEPYMGPLRLPSMVDNLLQKQENLIKCGANSLLKSEKISIGQTFVTPGIIDVTNVNNRSDEEILGPFLQVIMVPDFESALDEANNTEYGLAAGIFTEDINLYNRFQNEVRAGLLNWNQQLTGASPWAPFGGIKNSGNFRPSGYLASDFCVYSTASIEVEKMTFPKELPPGISMKNFISAGLFNK